MERLLHPRITIELLTDAAGFPLKVDAFGENTAETKALLSVIKAFITTYRLPDVTMDADAGKMPKANQKVIEAVGAWITAKLRAGQRSREKPMSYRSFTSSLRQHTRSIAILNDCDPRESR